MSQNYRTTPELTDRMPPGVPFIIGNELAERFSFYGMKAILVVYMTQYLLDVAGDRAPMSESSAKVVYHLFTMSAYAFPIFGAILSDWMWGKYRTILLLSIVYCVGHVALAASETRVGLAIGLLLIAVGAGGIKPCVSAHVGDQFGTRNQHLLPRVFSWFYFSINFGAAVSSLLTPVLLKQQGPWLAFGVPAVLMFLATLIFWMGRRKFVHIPPGGGAFLRQTFSAEGRAVIGRLFLVNLCIVPFWSLFDQTGSAWVLQAERMNLTLELFGRQVTLLSSQIQAANPFLILVFIPLFAYVIYPLVAKVATPTPLRKISVGLFISALAFMVCAWIETRIEAGEQPTIWWQWLAFAIITAAEVLVSITCLEFCYTQAPPTMKSFVMSFYLLSVAAGNLVTAGVNAAIEWSTPKPGMSGEPILQGAAYYWFFVYMMLATAMVFVIVARFYRGRTYIQGDKPVTGDA